MFSTSEMNVDIMTVAHVDNNKNRTCKYFCIIQIKMYYSKYVAYYLQHNQNI